MPLLIITNSDKEVYATKNANCEVKILDFLCDFKIYLLDRVGSGKVWGKMGRIVECVQGERQSFGKRSVQG